MLTKEKILDYLKENKKFLKDNYGVESIALFGSYAKNLQTEKSDIDLLVKLNNVDADKFLNLYLHFNNIFRKDISLIIENKQIQDNFRKIINKDIIYA